MRNLIGILLIFNAYIIIYYRLMLRYYTEQQTGRKESAFGAIFSFPPLRLFPEKGRKYFKRYWIAIGVMLLGVGYLASTSTFHFN